MGNLCKALICLAFVATCTGHARAQENPASPGTTQPDWIPYNGEINIDPGEYYILFRETETSCISEPADFKINLLVQPTAPVVNDIIQPTCVLATGSVVLSGLPEGDWIINPGSISGSGSTSTISGLVAGQSYTFTVTASNACISPSSDEVSIIPQPLTPATPTADLAQSFCEGNLVSDLKIIEQLPSGTTLLWYTTSQGGTHLADSTELESGTYYAAAISTEGCESERLAVEVTVNPLIPPAVSITTNKTEICEGDEVTFTAEISENVTEVNYQWYLNNVQTGINISTFTSSALKNGDEIYCSVSATGTCIDEAPQNSNVITIEISPKITVEVIDITDCGDEIGSFNANGLDPNKQYEYQLIPKGQAGKPVITILGDKTVTLTVGDTYTDAGAIAYDAVFGDLTTQMVTINTVNTAVAGTYTVSYNVNNPANQSADEVVRTVMVRLSSPQQNWEEVTIGIQTWMKHNLVIDDGQGGIYSYDDDIANAYTYGYLYTWDAAMRVAGCIEGWRLPLDVDWQTLVGYMGGADTAGGKLKEEGTTHWYSPNQGATNEIGFTALPGGVLLSDGSFISGGGENGFWWSATESSTINACSRYISYLSSKVDRSCSHSKEIGFSIRLIKDKPEDPDAFIMEFTMSANEQLTIPLVGTGYSFTIDWGDGSPLSEVTSQIDPDRIHTYTDAGNYAVRIKGTMPRISFYYNADNRHNLTKIVQWGDVGMNDLTNSFYECSNLTGELPVLPYSVTSIGSNAFYNCSGLTSITIPNSVTSIGNFAFYNCSGLTNITIPNSVTSIGTSAFYNCSVLTSIIIPNSVTSIGNSAFYNCSGLTSITIPTSVTTIGDYVFRNCIGLTSVTIPNSVTNIGIGSFLNCTGLTSVTIPNSVTNIGNASFRDCTGLTNVTIPNSVTSIGDRAFQYCSNSTLVVWIDRETPATLGGTSVFDNTASKMRIKVPPISITAYQTAQFWSEYVAKIISQ